jgi:hypothetical protein
MVIVYGIIGAFAAIFLLIVIIGAVCSRRHTGRYIPRLVAGRTPQIRAGDISQATLARRPRRSRARGIAQVVLDTIPLVKFNNDDDGVDAARCDVEMIANGPASEHSPSRYESIASVGQATRLYEPELATTEEPSKQPTTLAAGRESKTDAAPDEGNVSCPICTDDFVKGQDLRVLTCNHQFHPECIDPWLVNFSGTCPLWWVVLLTLRMTTIYPQQIAKLLTAPTAALISTLLRPTKRPNKKERMLSSMPTRMLPRRSPPPQ